MEKVYLAGTLNTTWQNRVIESLRGKFIFYNPQEHSLEESKMYTVWDLHYLKKSNIIFAYLNNENPSGYGLTLEIGYARALNKTIILVDEKSQNNPVFEKYFRIVRDSSSIVFDSLELGLKYLEKFSHYSG
jgi:nucleoside 2-deoxyribosyltransferase